MAAERRPPVRSAAGYNPAVSHDVTVERKYHVGLTASEVGGYAVLVSRLPGLSLWAHVVDWRKAQLAKLENVELTTGVALDAHAIREEGAEIVILATGSHWAADGLNHLTHGPIPGTDGAHVLTPERVLAGEEPPGESVLVYDCEGYFMGVGMAEGLRSKVGSMVSAPEYGRLRSRVG